MTPRQLKSSPAASFPTMGEIEGRFIALEFVASSSLIRLLRLHDGKVKSELTAEILFEVEQEARKSGLHFLDIGDAQNYAEALLKEAQSQADDLDHIKHACIRF